jgi:nicotinamide riboside transporter PnuC
MDSNARCVCPFQKLWNMLIITALYPSEVLAYNARAKGLAMSGLWLNIVSFINTYAAPVGITQGHWKFYFLYLAVDILGIVFIYFFFVETKVSDPSSFTGTC